MAGLVFLLLGFLGTLSVGGCIALATDAFKFQELLGCSITFLALVIMYEAFVMFILYTVDGKKADLIQCVPLVVALVGFMAWFIRKTADMADEQFTQLLRDSMDKINDIMTYHCIWILLVALFCMAISYIGSVFIQKKRGLK